MPAQFYDHLDVLFFQLDGQTWFEARGQKKGGGLTCRRAYAGSTDDPLKIAQYLLDADLPGAIKANISGEYSIDWHTEERTDEDGNRYEVNVIDGMRFKPIE